MRASEPEWKSTISVWFLILLLPSFSATTLYLNDHQEECKFPAIFNFGDSNSDTGGLADTFSAPKAPFGQTFFGMPEGRFSNGRLIIDFIAESLGIPYLGAYLDSLGTNFAHGANFAVYASPITPAKSVLPVGKFSPCDLDVQHWQFTEFKNRSEVIRKRGGIFEKMMPNQEYFSQALYTFDIGQNNLGERFLARQTMWGSRGSNSSNNRYILIRRQEILRDRSKKFLDPQHGTNRLLANLPNIKLDSAGCAKPYNDLLTLTFIRSSVPCLKILKRTDLRKCLLHAVGMDYGGKYNYNGKTGCGEWEWNIYRVM